jgi:heptaprenylglyceryl phosphate synthase
MKVSQLFKKKWLMKVMKDKTDVVIVTGSSGMKGSNLIHKIAA